jgi:hypothetical protein
MKTETKLMSEVVEQRTAAEFLDYELQDDYTPSGGISHQGETLEEFLQDICEEDEDITEMPIREVNQALTETGILPVPYHYENERSQYACMIAVYAAGVCQEYPEAYVDELPSLQKCIDLANSYDFPMIKDDWNGKDRWVIDTEAARYDAEKLARIVCEEAAKEHQWPGPVKQNEDGIEL